MKKGFIAKAVGITALSAALVCGIVGCASGNSSASYTGGVAATVNGADIPEDEVTEAVQEARTQMGLTETDAWGQWMAENDYTPEKVRDEMIEGFITQELVKQGVADRGIQVDAEEVQSYVDTMKSRYDSDEKWQEALKTANMTEDSYRQNIADALSSQKFVESFETEDPSEEEILPQVQSYAAMLDGAKKSSHILFDASDEATAQEVLDKINAGELDFADAAMQYSKDSGSAADGGNVGWDKMTTFVSEYQDALDGLATGEVSGLVPSTYGIHIIKCTEEFIAPEEVTSSDQIPAEFLESITSSLKQSKQTEAYSTWLEETRETAEITINPMPAGLPYYVDMAEFEKTDEATDDSDTTGDVDIPDATDGTESSDSDVAGAEGDVAVSGDTAEGSTDEASAEADAESETSVDAGTADVDVAEADSATDATSDQPSEAQTN